MNACVRMYVHAVKAPYKISQNNDDDDNNNKWSE